MELVTETWATKFADWNRTRKPVDRSALCNAPSVSMNFDQSGNVTACCYNRRYVLGTYPKHSIKEIWEGPRIKRLRDLLKAGDLSKGCERCQFQLEANNHGGLMANLYDNYLGDESRELLPKIFEFEIGDICNLECVMCNGHFSSSIRKNRELLRPLAKVYDQEFVEQLKPFLPHVRMARFAGGEPFLNPIYYSIWQAILEINNSITCSLTTNGTVMNDKVRKMVAALKPEIGISIDSLDKTVYESIRVNARFESVFDNLLELLYMSKMNRKGVTISLCPMTMNWRTIPEILEFCNRHVVFLVCNTVLWPRHCSIRFLPKPEIARIADYLEKSYSKDLADSPHLQIRNNFHAYDGMVRQIRAWSLDVD